MMKSGQAIQETIKLLLNIFESRDSDHSHHIITLNDYIQYSAKQFSAGYQDCEIGQYRGKSDAYEAGFSACYAHLESNNEVENRTYE